ncbi:MAG: GC-type dockerin domain-anchored protein, partial [Planctomycetota bacterium]
SIPMKTNTNHHLLSLSLASAIMLTGVSVYAAPQAGETIAPTNKGDTEPETLAPPSYGETLDPMTSKPPLRGQGYRLDPDGSGSVSGEPDEFGVAEILIPLEERGDGPSEFVDILIPPQKPSLRSDDQDLAPSPGGSPDAAGFNSLTPTVGQSRKCPADCFPPGGNGVVNVDDLQAFLADYAVGSHRCDIAPPHADGTYGDGDVDIDDLMFLLNAFGTCAP